MHPVPNGTIKAYAVHQLFENLLILEQMFVSSKHGCLGHSLQLPFSKHTWLRSLPSLTWTVMASDRSTNGSHSNFGSVERLQPTRLVVQPNVQCVYCMPASLSHTPLIHLTSSLESGPKSDWTAA